MKNSLAFISLVFIWSTTPLAIKWSAVEFGMSSLFIRMLIGATTCLVVLALVRRDLNFQRHNARLYAIVAASIYLSMVLVYWASQSIPSGWIAIIWSTSPLMTGLCAYLFTSDEKLSLPQGLSMLLSSLGIVWIFYDTSIDFRSSMLGLTLCLLGTLSSSVSSVAVRDLSKNSGLSGLNITTGGLLLACPLFLLTALSIDNGIQTLSTHAFYATIYLGLIGSCVGFVLYYYLLKAIAAERVAMVTLITPINALLLGNYLNGEPLNARIWIGAAFVLCGIFAYYYLPSLGKMASRLKSKLPFQQAP